MPAKLVVVSGQNPGAEYHLFTDRLVIGRSDEADVVVVDRSVSRRHIEVVREGVGFTVRDLSSGNGTFLNGSRIREAELISGDRVEIGSHALQFFEDPPTRQPHERQVVYSIDPNQGASAPPPQQHAPPPPAQLPAAPQQVHVPVPKKVIAAPPRRRPAKKKGGAAAWLVALLAFVFLGLAGAIGYVFYKRANTAEPAAEDVVGDHVTDGQDALSRMAWTEAQDQFNIVLQSDPDNAAAAEGLSVARTEQRFADLMDEADRHISVGEYTHAIVNLRTVQSESPLQSGVAEARLTRLFDELVTEGRAAVDRGDFAAAEAFASVVLEANPNNRSATALLDEVEVVRGQREAVANPTVAEATPPPAEEESERRSSRSERREHRSSREERPREERSSESTVAAVVPTPTPTPTPAPEREEHHSSRGSSDPGQAFARGWRMHSEGDFDGAAAWFEEYADGHSDELGDQATQIADQIRSFSDAFVPGRESYQSADWDVAVADLRRAFSLDRRLEETYRSEISGMLADSYYHIAQNNYDSGDYRDAGENARIALRYDSNHEDTRGLVRRLEDRANELYINAVSFRESNPERARQLCRDIENMLPESSDLRRRATELREQL